MLGYPKLVTVSSIDPQLYYGDTVRIDITVIVPSENAQELLNRIGAIL